eukprot:6180123-Pleurochrysis_carterae.AAC.1
MTEARSTGTGFTPIRMSRCAASSRLHMRRHGWRLLKSARLKPANDRHDSFPKLEMQRTQRCFFGASQMEMAKQAIAEEQKKYRRPIVTEVKMAQARAA